MSMEVCYELQLTIAGPFLSQASGTLETGLDTATLRYQDMPVINGSLIRGNLRDCLNRFALKFHGNKQSSLQKKVIGWFGPNNNPNDEDADGNPELQFKPKRGNVRFDLFWKPEINQKSEKPDGADKSAEENNTRTRIKIDEQRGNVEEGALQVIEDAFKSGRDYVFCGEVKARFANKAEREQFELWIKRALDFIPALGGLKGIGYGRLISSQLKQQGQSKKATLPALAENTTRFGLSFSLNQPFCLGKPRTPKSNRIVSAEIITGNVIKAVIAAQYDNDGKQLEEKLCFDQLVFSHCLPALKDQPQRHVALPLSLAIDQETGKQTLLDTSHIQQPDSHVWNGLIAFRPDWKSEQENAVTTALLKEGSAIPEPATTAPERILLIRTGINAQTQTAQESTLFSTECIDPEKHIWCGNIDLSRVAESKRAGVLANLRKCLENGLNNIGKTKADATDISLYPQPFVTMPAVPFAVGDEVSVTLLSNARLLPAPLEQQIKDGKTPEQLYADYWKTCSDGGLKLERFFAQQERHGGAYHHHHFQKGQSYTPEWLSSSGSVFVLSIINDDGKRLLEEWLHTGLPASRSADGQPAHWKTTPYLPEHGFGEIAANLFRGIKITLPDNKATEADAADGVQNR